MTVIWSSIEAESCFISREHYDCLPSMEFFSVIPYPGSDPAYLLKFYQKKIIAELFGSCLCHVALHNNCDMCINITFCLKFQTAPNQVRTEKYRNTSGDQRQWMSEKAIANVLLLHYISFHSILFFFSYNILMISPSNSSTTHSKNWYLSFCRGILYCIRRSLMNVHWLIMTKQKKKEWTKYKRYDFCFVH